MNIQEEKIVGNIITCNLYVKYIRYSEMSENKMKCLNDFNLDDRRMA